MKSDNGPIFNEFTPRPGPFAEFTVCYDRMLGDEFLAAEARLVSDLFKGKRFNLFNIYLADTCEVK